MTAACSGCAAPAAAIEPAQTPKSKQFSVPAIRCAACISAIEGALIRNPQIRDARVNLSKRRVSISTDLSTANLTDLLAEIGYEAHPLNARTLATDVDRAGQDLLMRLGVAGFAMMNVMLLSVAVWSGATGATRDLFHLLSAVIALPAMLYSAQPFFMHAKSALLAGRLNMDVPISLAILLAGAMSLFETLHGGNHAFFDAGLSLTFFLLIGRYLEHRTRASARSAAKELTALEVHTAKRRVGNLIENVQVTDLLVGDKVFIPSGARVPVDGQLTYDSADTDRSFLTGESDPIVHSKGDLLHAGEINLGHPFEIRATAVGQDTRFHQIANLVETAENARNKYTSLADRAAQIYAPAVHLIAAVTFLGWFATTKDFRFSMNIAIAVLIITCPCALGLAVPAVSTAAISRLYRLGFLVKSGTALERLSEVKTVALDKTGTLTMPGFVVKVPELPLNEQRIAKALAQASDHPVSKALNIGLEGIDPIELSNVREEQGMGVSGLLGQTHVALGKASWLGAVDEGLVLKIGDQFRAIPYVERSRDGAKHLVTKLKALGFRTEILSGDTQEKTAKLAKNLGVNDFSAGMLPEDKSKHIEELQRAGQMPCMIGDGLNDTIALTSAHVSIAPGSALNATRSAADVIIVGKSLTNVSKLFVIAKDAVRLSRQNFGIALTYNAIAVPLAIAGYATPLMAALAMSLSSLTVLLNALRVGRGI